MNRPQACCLLIPEPNPTPTDATAQFQPIHFLIAVLNRVDLIATAGRLNGLLVFRDASFFPLK